MAWAYDLISRTTIDSNRNPNVSKSFRRSVGVASRNIAAIAGSKKWRTGDDLMTVFVRNFGDQFGRSSMT